MARYQVRYASTFFKAMDKLDRGTQKVIAKWIDKHLVNVDFRVGSYRIIAKVDEEDFVILNIHVAKRSEVYNFKGED